MDTDPSVLLPVLASLCGSWLCLSAFVMGSRVLHDRHRRAVEQAAGTAPSPTPRALSRLAGVQPSAATLLAADAAAPLTPEIRRAAQAEAAEHRTRLLKTATSHRSELGRWRRVAALRILARAEDPEALPLLERALSEGDAELTGAAVDIIGSLDGRPAAELLVRLLTEGTYSRSRIASHLDRASVPIDDLLLPLLDDSVPSVRFWAATLLSGYARKAKVGVVLAALSADADPNVRAAAAESLGSTRRSPERDAALHELLADPVWYVRVHAARSIGSLALTSEAPVLAGLLADTEWWVRAAAKDGLTALGPSAYPEVIAALDHPDRFARNGAAEVLQNTGYVDTLLTGVLAPTGAPDREQVELLKHIVEAGGDELRESTLARSGSPEARERLERLLGGEGGLAAAA